MRRLLAVTRSGGTFQAPAGWPNADSIAADLEGLFANNAFDITVGGNVVATGFEPANGHYNALWTRDHALTLWHYPGLLTATQRRTWVDYWISRRTTGVESDPDGGTLPADFIADRIQADGTAIYKNAGASDLPFMDGIAFVVLALWTDWNETGSTTTFTSNQSAIDDCLAAIPRSVNGCVYSDPAAPSVDFGFTDTNKKTGDVAYGTALQAWAYKMLAEIAGEGGSGTYSTLRAAAEAGLATLRQSSGWYEVSSVNDAGKDDVWATALAVAEGLVTGQDANDSAETLRDAYLAGTISQSGLVRHLPSGQYFADSSTTADTYQNGGYWLTPLWNCYRAVRSIDVPTAVAWVQEALDEVEAEIAASGALNAPYEWRNGGTISTPKGYTAHAAIVHRFASL